MYNTKYMIISASGTLNDNTREPWNGLRKLNMITLVRPSLCYNYVRRVTVRPPCYRPPAVLLSLSVFYTLFTIDEMELFLYTGNCISKEHHVTHNSLLYHV